MSVASRAAVGGLDGPFDVLHAHAVTGARLAVDVGDDVLRAARPVDLDVARAARRAQDPIDLGQLLVHEVEILAVDLHHHLAADARDRLLDAILDRLAEVVDDAGPPLEPGAHQVDDLLLGAPGLPLALGLHDHERLGLVRRLVVGAVLRVALLGQDVLHLLEGEQREARLAQHLGAAIQRDGAGHRDGDVDVAFVHLGQEFGAQPGHQRHRQRQHADAGDRRTERVAQRHPQHGQIARAQPAQEPRLLLGHLAVLEQHRGQRRDGGHA